MPRLVGRMFSQNKKGFFRGICIRGQCCWGIPNLIRDSLVGILHFLRILTWFVLRKLYCKYVFENDVSSLVVFCQLWREEVHMQLQGKGFLLIKDAKLLDFGTYSNLIAILATLRKRM